MKKLLFILPIYLLSFSLSAQNTEGVVHYERKVDWIKMIKKMPWLSQEEKDRMEQTFKNEEEEDIMKQKFNLYFNEKQAIYTWGQEHQEYGGGYVGRNEELVLFKDFDKGTRKDMVEMLGKTYLVEDSLKKPAWKVLNQIKDVAGYVCMKAVLKDVSTKQNIVVWFTGDIPVSAGMGQLWGLPGMILEMDIDEGSIVVEAKSVELKKLDKEMILSKMKGKKTTGNEMEKVISKYISDNMKSNRNPYWAIMNYYY